MVFILAAIAAYRYHQTSQPEDINNENSNPIDTVTNSPLVLRVQAATRQTSEISQQLLYVAFSKCQGSSDSTADTSATYSIEDLIMSEEALILPDVFRSDIRNGWIDAVFGTDFFADAGYVPPPQGMGTAGIPNFFTYQASIPAQAVDRGDKVGITVSRIALGLYVRHVEQGSEACCAGVQEGSILIDINGMGMLGEPSRNALERLWQYEGHFDQPAEDDGVSIDSSQSSSNSSEERAAATHHPKSPLALRFINGDGAIYTCLFLSNPPFGISWAPCGNFALVQRSYSFAQESGVRRGGLLAAVNGRSLRNMDHEETALELRQYFVDGQEIELTLAYPPAASRSGYFEQQDKDSRRRASPTRRREVEGRRRSSGNPVGYSMSALWNCGASLDSVGDKTMDEIKLLEGSIAQLASKVAAGEVEAPSGMDRRRRSSAITSTLKSPKIQVYGPCPSIPDMLGTWNLIDALTYCLRCHEANFDHTVIEKMAGEPGSSSRTDELRQLTKSKEALTLVQPFLLQWISVLCNSSGEELEEASEERELASMLLGMSRRNEEFSQQLYFLLRSYTAVLEDRRKSSKKEGNNRSLLTLLQALDRLRSAQRQLTSQISKEEVPTSPLTIESDVSVVATSTSVSSGDQSSLASQDGGERLSPPIKVPSRESSSSSKKRSITKLFRRRTIKSSTKERKPLTITTRKQATSPTHDKEKSGCESQSPKTAIALSKTPKSLGDLTFQLEHMSVSTLLENMTRFLSELDNICDSIERSMLKSVSQKIADWALQPWTARKGNDLAKVTEGMRRGLCKVTKDKTSKRLPLVNPFAPSEVLTTLDTDECYILPSAHFPLLLTFHLREKLDISSKQPKATEESWLDEEKMYRTTLEIVSLRGSATPTNSAKTPSELTYFVSAAVAGTIKESGRSMPADSSSKTHKWGSGSRLTFDSRSSWGPPQTVSLRLSSVSVGENGQDQVTHTDENGRLHYSSEVGFCWVDLNPVWDRIRNPKNGITPQFSTVSCNAQIWSLDDNKTFDAQGDLVGGLLPTPERLEIELRVTTETIPFQQGFHSRKRMLLYKHDDDLRQEMFAIHFIETCSRLLKASGLDLQLLTFRCIPVGDRRGFIEWVPGSVPLSDICKPFAGSIIAGKEDDASDDYGEDNSISEVSKAGLSKYLSLFQHLPPRGERNHSVVAHNPIQDFLRSVAYDPDAPYLISRSVMDSYVKSCAGYCVLTYLLGVGDRHLDNLLLHQSGRFFHCDYSFILGNDPKKYLPMRITEDMVSGMGGRDSDNYAKFLSLAGAAFIALRRHENVRLILSLVRLMVPSALPDVSINQSPEEVVLGMRNRLRLDLPDDKALTYIESLIEKSIASKMWLAVDAIHTLGKRF